MANKIAPRMERRGGGGINRLAAIVEPAMTAGSNILAEIPAYAAGMAELNKTGLPSEGVRRAEEVSERLTYNPRTMEGQAGLQSLTNGVMKVMDALGVDEAINYLNNTIVPNLQRTFGEEGAREIGSSVMMALPFVRKVTLVPGVLDDALDYRGGHTAPVRTKEDYNAPLSEINKIYPDDIYDKTNQVRYYGHGQGEAWESESFDVINAARGNPDMEIEIYRAVPNSAPDEINAGDWVTPSKGYAQLHGERFGDDGGKVLVSKVKAGDLFTEGNSPHEFGWSPSQTFDPTTADISHLSKPDQFRYESAIDNENWERAAELVRKPSMKAFHGSPHDFDKFSMDAIDTGEGAQAYGHGLYAGEAQGTGFQYYKQGLEKNLNRPLSMVEEAVAKKKASGLSPMDAMGELADEGWEFDGIQKSLDTIYNNPARFYQVEIDASPDEFLDWDLPLSEQSDRVKNNLRGLESSRISEAVNNEPKLNSSGDYWEYMGNTYESKADALEDFTTQNIVHSNRAGIGENPTDVSASLKNSGIKGIRYKDGFSRGADGGTYNYVIFDDRLISIAKKYGIAIPAAAALLSQETGLNPSSLYEEDNPV